MPEIHKIYAPGEELPEGVIGSPCPAGDGELHIRFIDVGLGNCTYVICPNGKRLLIDAGSTNMGNRTVNNIRDELNYDAASGDLYIDVLVISHAHQDHQNLIGNLVWGSPIQAIYYGANTTDPDRMAAEYNTYGFRLWLWNYANSPFIQQLLVNEGNTTPQIICEGGVAGGPDCTITAIAASVVPAPASSQSFENRKNTASVVVKIDFGTDHILIMADATADTENFMRTNPASNALLPSNVLMVPHHGSDTSSTQAFIDRVAPETVLISCKDQNRHQLPKRAIVDRYLDAASVRELITDQTIATYDPTVWPTYAPLETQKDVWQTGTTDQLLNYEFTGV